MAIKVSQKTVAQLRKGTMASNLAKAKNASPEMKEALVRFYGAKRVNAAVGTPASKAPAAKRTGSPSAVSGAKPKAAPSQATRMDKPKAKATGTTAAKSKSVFAPSGKKSTPVERGYDKAYNAVKSQGKKPFVDVPAVLSNAQKKSKAKAAANQALYNKQQAAAKAKKK